MQGKCKSTLCIISAFIALIKSVIENGIAMISLIVRSRCACHIIVLSAASERRMLSDSAFAFRFGFCSCILYSLYVYAVWAWPSVRLRKDSMNLGTWIAWVEIGLKKLGFRPRDPRGEILARILRRIPVFMSQMVGWRPIWWQKSVIGDPLGFRAQPAHLGGRAGGCVPLASQGAPWRALGAPWDP